MERFAKEACLILLEEDFLQKKDFFRWLKENNLSRVLVESPSFAYELLEFKLLKEMWVSTCGVFSGEKTGSRKGFAGKNLPRTKLLSLHQNQGEYLYARYCIE